METVGLEKVVEEDEAELKRLIENHVNYTGSTVGQQVLDNWEAALLQFKKVMPTDYKRVLNSGALTKRHRGRRGPASQGSQQR